MYNYEIWNKKDPIKGFDAEYWLSNNPEFREGDVVLFKNKLNIVERVESINTLKLNNDIEPTLSTEETVQRYLEILEEEKTKQEKHILSLEKQSEEVAMLKEENQALKEAMQVLFATANLELPQVLK